MKLLKKVLLALVFIFVISTLGASFLIPHIASAAVVQFSDFEKIAPEVYVSPGTPQIQKDSLLHLLSVSKERNTAFWGKTFPVRVIFCHDPEVAKSYGYRGNIASFAMTPFFSFVLFTPDALSPDVVSHEMCHPELFNRLGWFRHEMLIPVWFYEGIGMQLDDREHYSETTWKEITGEGKTAPSLIRLKTREGFYTDAYQVNYSTAKHEVARWLAIVGQEGLYQLIDNLSLNSDFDRLYADLEKVASERKKTGH